MYRRAGLPSDRPDADPAPGLDDDIARVLARYQASRWNMADGCTGVTRQLPAREGEVLRGVPNSGTGSRRDMEMLNWVGVARGVQGKALAPLMRRIGDHWCSDHSARNTWGFWCKRTVPQDGVHPLPRNRVPYNLQDPHFALMALSVPGHGHSGVAFQASKAEEDHASELALSNNRPQARWTDSQGRRLVLASPETLVAGQPAVIALTSAPGRQSLRLNGQAVAMAHESFAPSNFAQLLIGWGFRSYFPNEGFGGHVFGVITGKGAPGEAELLAMERHLGGTAGLAL